MNTNWGLRLRHKSLLEGGQARSFTAPRPPRRVLRPHHLGTGATVKAANLARLRGVTAPPGSQGLRWRPPPLPPPLGPRRPGPQAAAASTTPSPPEGPLASDRAPPPSGPASPGQSAGPPRHQEGEGRAERPGPRGRSFRLLKINGALGRGEQEGSFGKGLEVTETPAGTQLGFPARNSCLTHQASGQVGPQARARRSGRGFCSLGGR